MSREFYESRLPLVERGEIKRTTVGDYSVWCYSRQTYYDMLWSDIVCATRGVVTHDPSQTIVARPMDKMDSLHMGEKDLNRVLDVTEKIDGTMITVFSHNGQLMFATKNSLENRYIDKARELWGNRGLPLDGVTLMCELTHNSEEIVIKPKEECLYLIAARGTLNGIDFNNLELDTFAAAFNLKRPIHFKATLTELRELAHKNKNMEGWVASYEKEPCVIHRIKVKTLWYLKRQKWLNHLTPKVVREAWAAQEINELLEIADDQPWITDLLKELDEVETTFFNEVLGIYRAHSGFNKKYLAEALAPIRGTHQFHAVMCAVSSDKPLGALKEHSIKYAVKTVKSAKD